ncbi:huntingtin-interacting protein 1-like isoform X2 [Brienomyrus brachyistius]|uniref:huntingtin-interacting protein 1-like isoform X2 n=1 Tax=Brienomyrus brachyistius TaxID=42636 RepID=UPI0020B374CA|nr:huntingtin-interacting protein 1-like isoform X2 [Brienomyrus brachyistius]
MDLTKMTVSINKAINAQELAVKEKHARTCILGTHHEKGAHTFWMVVSRLPLSSNAVLCWKFCHVLHKLLRDGHPNVIKDSMRSKANLCDMSKIWGHLAERYGKLCSVYLKLLVTKMEFHIKNPHFPGNLQMSDRQLDYVGENDVNNLFQITVEMLDYLECELNLFLGVFSSLDMSRSVSETAAGQCRLAPLIQVVLDSSYLYDCIVKLLFKLHCCLPADTLLGHRDRFQEQFIKLKDLFYRSSNLQYFKRLIQIPQLPENPPNFFRSSALSDHISPAVLIPTEPQSPENEHLVETEDLVSTEEPVTLNIGERIYDDVMGASATLEAQGGQDETQKDDKDLQIRQLTRDLQTQKEELASFQMESSRLCQALQGRVRELEAELEEQRHLRQQALGEEEFLRVELEDLRRLRDDTQKEQRSLTEIERKAQVNEQRYSKLKEKYSGLVQSHADLLRKHAEVTQQVRLAEAARYEVELHRRGMQDKARAACGSAGQWEDGQEEQQALHRQLLAVKKELDSLKESMASSEQPNDVSSHLSALEAERAELAQGISYKEQEVVRLKLELEQAQTRLAGETKAGKVAAESLQNQVKQKANKEQALESQLAAVRKAALQGALDKAQRIIQDSLVQPESPAHHSCTCFTDHLLSQCQAALDCVDRLQIDKDHYAEHQADVLQMVQSVAQLGHLVGDVIVQAGAPVDQGSSLSQAMKIFGSQVLMALKQLQDPDTMENADVTGLRVSLETIRTLAKNPHPHGLELDQGELASLVEQEMAATSVTVETATTRMEEMLNETQTMGKGIKMEVFERILVSCTELMLAVKALLLSSKDLHQDIVESGRGAVSVKEFYVRNSRWTEGLISASKAVGLNAAMMMDVAGQLIQGHSKFEELMVSSHEVAASTAQLLAASKVKADKDSPSLARLQHASHRVTQAAARVVASGKSGKSHIEEMDSMDFTSMTLMQIKRDEMDLQGWIKASAAPVLPSVSGYHCFLPSIY